MFPISRVFLLLPVSFSIFSSYLSQECLKELANVEWTNIIESFSCRPGQKLFLSHPFPKREREARPSIRLSGSCPSVTMCDGGRLAVHTRIIKEFLFKLVNKVPQHRSFSLQWRWWCTLPLLLLLAVVAVMVIRDHYYYYAKV